MTRRLLTFFVICLTVKQSYGQNYTVLGSATPTGGCNCFTITPDAENQAGAIFQNSTINLNNSFDYTFNVFLGCNGSGGADGLMFVLTSNPNGLGNPGEGLGYAGSNQPYSFAVEFDTWENGNAGDPSFDHIGINSGGLYNHNVAGPVPAVASQAAIDDCGWHTVRIVWDVNSNTYSVYFDGVLRQQITVPNMVNTYFGGNPVVNWGWSAATGGGTNLQQVCVLSQSNWVGGVNYQSCDLTVAFQDVSTSNVGSISSWAWSFGDGTTSNQQNPSHTYSGYGTYNVSLTIVDVNGCSNTYSHPIVINTPITIAPTLSNPPCNGGSNGGITVVPSGGFGPAAGYGGYAYNWSNGTSQSSLVGASAGTYTLTVTDGVCITTAQYTLNQPPPLTATVSQTDASCGANNGTATLNITGGTQPYTAVSWASIYFGNPVTGLPPGFYIADFNDANGCSALLQYSVTIGSLPCGYSFSTSSTGVSCFGGSNGTATLTASGGPAPVNISWSNGGSGPTITGLTAGVYTYNYSDGSGYSTSGSVTVIQPGAALSASLSTLNTSCSGSNDGQAIASVLSGGNAPYSYQWSSGSPNNAVANNLGPGPISVTITDANLCTATASGNITGPPNLSLTISTVDDSCYQQETGSATANVSGGNPTYLYYWSNISSAQTNLSLGAGTYTVTVTDDKGCTITGSAVINQPTPLTHTISSTNVLCNGASTGSISASASGGTGGITYTWNPVSATGSNPTGLQAGQYNVTIADANNCQRFDSVVIAQPASALSVVTSHTDVTCNGLSNGTITITINGGTPPYSYLGNPIPAGTTTLNNLAPNTYSGNVLDFNNCSVSVSETISEPGPQSLTMSSTATSCNGGIDGSATANFVNATGFVNYAWSNAQSGSSINNLSANTYTVTATDANSCSLSATVAVSEPSAPVMTVTVVDATCFGGNGSVTANPTGSGPFSYTWSAGTSTNQTVNLPFGSYTVTATDGASCNQTAAFSVNQAPEILISETHTNLDCFGDSDGDIVLTPSGGTGSSYSYNWNPNVSTNNVASLLPAGVYDITVSDQAGCPKTISITLTQPATPLAVNIQSTNVSCFGVSNGSIKVTASGSTAPYTYAWNPNVTSTDSASNLGPGFYSITITDFNGCSSAPGITISGPNQPLTITPSQTSLTCYQSNDGTASVSVSGGTFPYTYSWSANIAAATATVSGLSAGAYTVTVTDLNSCTNSETFILTEPTQLTISETHTDVLCNGDNTGDVTLMVSGGTGGPAYFYVWSPNVSITNTATNLTAGTYNITATDSNACTVLLTVVITEPAALQLTASANDVSCFGETDGSITSTFSGGTPNYNFSATQDNVTFINSTTGQFSSLAAGNYTMLLTDGNNCTVTVTAVVGEPAVLSAVLNITDALCVNESNGSIDVVPSGGNPGYVFSLSNGAANNSGSFTGLAEGLYFVTITDNAGCTYVDSAEINEPDSVLITVSPDPVEVNLGETLQLTTTTNQTGVLIYYWSPEYGLSCSDCANPLFSGVFSQPYSVTVVNSNGCEGTYQFNVIVVVDYSLFFPNAFTPNGDGSNDEWQVFGKLDAIKQFEIQVFNRIGEKVFESNDVNFKWNPQSQRYKNGDLPNGVYVYQAKVVWLDNHSDANYKGSLTILR